MAHRHGCAVRNGPLTMSPTSLEARPERSRMHEITALEITEQIGTAKP